MLLTAKEAQLITLSDSSLETVLAILNKEIRRRAGDGSSMIVLEYDDDLDINDSISICVGGIWTWFLTSESFNNFLELLRLYGYNVIRWTVDKNHQQLHISWETREGIKW